MSNIENIMKAYNCTNSSNINATLPTYEDVCINNKNHEDLNQTRLQNIANQSKIIDIVHNPKSPQVVYQTRRRSSSKKKQRPQSGQVYSNGKCLGLKGAQENIERVVKLIRNHCHECKAYAKKIERVVS